MVSLILLGISLARVISCWLILAGISCLDGGACSWRWDLSLVTRVAALTLTMEIELRADLLEADC